jgi:Surface-adhesin protein E
VVRIGEAIVKKFMFVLLCLSIPAWADWKSVGENDAGTFYADPDTIVRDGSTARMWSVLDYKDFQRMVEVGYFSQKTQTEFDCAERRFRGLNLSFRAGHMGEGEVIYSDDSPHDWEPVAAGTVTEHLWTVACKG